MFKRTTQKYFDGLESQLYKPDIGIGVMRKPESRPKMWKLGKYLAYPYSAIDKALNYGKKVAGKAILTGLVAGMCYGSSWTQSSEEPDYFPLQVGNRWVYEYFKNDKATGRTRELFVSGTTSINKQAYFVLTGSMLRVLGFGHDYLTPDNPKIDTIPVRKDSSGSRVFFRFKQILKTSKEEKLCYDFNLDLENFPEELWSWSTGYPMVRWTYEKIPGKVSVDVPAGSFDNVIKIWRYTPHIMDNVTPIEYFAPYVGLVKVDLLPGFEGNVYHWALTQAVVDGIGYPQKVTVVESATWGRIKSTFTK